MQPKPSAERRSRNHHPVRHGQHHGRTLSARRYLEFGRQPRLHGLPRRRPPYLEATVTAAVFI